MPLDKEIYLDNSATTKPLPEVQEAVAFALSGGFGNPSSVHSSGDRARESLSLARSQVAKLISGEPDNLIFTSSGTEANNLVLSSLAKNASFAGQIITSEVEHSSVLKTCEHLNEQGINISFLSVNSGGLINPEDLRSLISRETFLVSIQWVNNETGVIQPIKEISKICKANNVLLHVDAAQAVGKIPLDLTEVDIDFLTLTGHKFHAPPGVGVLHSKLLKKIRPLTFGGPQELGLKPGTENLPGIVGIGKAAELRKGNFSSVLRKTEEMRSIFEEKILHTIPGTKINGDTNFRSGNSTNILFDGIDGQALVVRLDQCGIRCSQSSACTNMRPEPSYVLRAMGLSENEAYSSIRFSFSEQNTLGEVDMAVEAISKLCEEIRPISELISNSR